MTRLGQDKRKIKARISTNRIECRQTFDKQLETNKDGKRWFTLWMEFIRSSFFCCLTRWNEVDHIKQKPAPENWKTKCCKWFDQIQGCCKHDRNQTPPQMTYVDAKPELDLVISKLGPMCPSHTHQCLPLRFVVTSNVGYLKEGHVGSPILILFGL